MIAIHTGGRAVTMTHQHGYRSARVSVSTTPSGKWQVEWRSSNTRTMWGRRCTFFGRDNAMAFARAKGAELAEWVLACEVAS